MDLQILMAKRTGRRNAQAFDTGMDTGIGECEIHAYVDGRLDRRRRRAVEAHLALHSAQAEKANAYALQIAMLRQSFGGDEPMSHTLQTLRDRWKTLSAQRCGQTRNNRPDHKAATERGLPPRR